MFVENKKPSYETVIREQGAIIIHQIWEEEIARMKEIMGQVKHR